MLDLLRERTRYLHCSLRTEQAHLYTAIRIEFYPLKRPVWSSGTNDCSWPGRDSAGIKLLAEFRTFSRVR
jgi:hypothetical protein